MRIAVLGPLLIDTGAGPAPVGGRRLRALLARLALDAGRPVRPETLAGDLWADGHGDGDPTASGGALQSLASRLRRSLGSAAGPGLVDHGPGGYRLAVDRQDVDALQFEALAAEGRRALAAGDVDRAVDQLDAALRLWRGPALADVRDAPFAGSAADRLERLRAAALEDRAEAELARTPGGPGGLSGSGGSGADRLAALVEELRELTEAHPLRERAHALLLRTLQAAGRPAEALAHHAAVRRLLADELGSDPGPELRAAHDALLRGTAPSRPEPPPTAASSPPPAQGARGVPGNLPASLSSFVGREDDLHRVTSLVGSHRLVSLVGPGGAGKTRLAVEAARRLAGSAVPDGAWLVALAPVTAGDDVTRAVLAALDLRDPSRGEVGPIEPHVAPDHVAPDPTDRLVAGLAGRQALLVLDNCEHVVAAAAGLAEHLLERCPRLRLLVTTREPLRVPGEQLHAVPPLGLPAAGDPQDRVGAADAVRLFADRAAAARPGFVLDATTIEAAVEICRRLDGLPLAIELAAARLRSLPVQAVADRLDDRFRLLTQGARTALPRHQTLRAVVDWSWDLLDDAERTLVERLSVLPGGFDEDAAGFVAPEGSDPADLLAMLVDKSLLQVTPLVPDGTVRYRMLETIREYGIERLAERGEVAAVRAAFCRHFVAFVETAEPHLRARDQLPWLAALTTEHPNLLAAIRWAADAADGGTAARLVAGLSWYWTIRSSFSEAASWLEVVRPVLGILPAEEPGAAAAVVLTMSALSAAASGEPVPDDVVTGVRTALENAAPAAGPPLLVLAVPTLAVLTGRPAEGRAFIEAHSGHPDPWTRAALHLLDGVLAENTGDVPRALRVLPIALAGFRSIGDRWGTATALSSLGEVLPFAGRLTEAADALQEAIRHSAMLGDTDHATHLELRLIDLQLRLGAVDDAERRIEELGRPEHGPRSVHRQAAVQLSLAELDLRAGRTDVARARALAALAAVAEVASSPPQVSAITASFLARLEAAVGRTAEAATWLRDPAVAAVLGWDMPVAARVTVAAAVVRTADDDPEGAAELLGLAVALRGAPDPSDPEAKQVTDAATAVLGAEGFDAAFRRGATLSKEQAKERLVAVLGLLPPDPPAWVT